MTVQSSSVDDDFSHQRIDDAVDVSDSQPVLMPKSGSLSTDFVWRDQFALSMLIDLKPTSES